MYIYSDPNDENDPHKLPDVEVWHSHQYECEVEGFYYWHCFPGYLPEGDGQYYGPFPTAEAAITAARAECEQ